MSLLSVRAKGPLELMLRLTGLLLLVGAVFFGFWKNSERHLERLNAAGSLADEVQGLSASEREHVQRFSRSLRSRYGLEARVQIARTRPVPPPADGKTLYLGLGLEDRTAVVQLPPLLAGALGADFARRLETEHFPFHFAPGRSWQKGLLAALDLVESRLAALGATPQPQPPALVGGAQDSK